MDSEKIKRLVSKYLRGETSLDEEKLLRSYFKEEEISDGLRSYIDQFAYFESAKNKEPRNEFDPLAKIEPVEPNTNRMVNKPLVWLLRIAAGIILLLTGFIAGQNWSVPKADGEQMVALQDEVRQMKQALIYGSGDTYQQASASERLSLVRTSTNLSVSNGMNEQITDILVYTMNNDESVNVRQAAAEALFKFRDDPAIQKVLVNGLSQQEAPMMQITLIDMLVTIKAKGAVNEMNRLLMNTETRDVVKQRLRAGIAELQL